MKHSMVVFIIAIGLLFSAQAVFCTDAGPGKALYSKYLSAKIESCDRTASMFSAYPKARMKEQAEMRAAQTEFYRKFQCRPSGEPFPPQWAIPAGSGESPAGPYPARRKL